MQNVYEYRELSKVIAESAPLLMIDRLAIEDGGQRAVGIKAVSMDEAFFQGHFPGGPIMPGMLQIAAMRQAGEALVRTRTGSEVVFRLTGLKRAKFRRPVVPGDLLRVETTLKENDGAAWTFAATTSVGGKTACSATLIGTAVDPGAASANPRSCDDVLPAEWSETAADATRIMDMIPHRFPFQLLDRVAVIEPPTHIVGIKNVTGGEPWFRGTALTAFPEYLQIEASAQAGCALALTAPENEGKLGYFMSVDEMEFFDFVRPGDQLVLDMTVQQRGRFGVAEGRFLVAGKVVGQGSMKFAVVDRPEDS